MKLDLYLLEIPISFISTKIVSTHIRESGSNGEMTVVSHDTDNKRLLVYKKTSDAAGTVISGG